MTDRNLTLERARAIVGHGSSTTYPSRASARYVRDVLADLLRIVEEPRPSRLEIAKIIDGSAFATRGPFGSAKGEGAYRRRQDYALRKADLILGAAPASTPPLPRSEGKTRVHLDGGRGRGEA